MMTTSLLFIIRISYINKSLRIFRASEVYTELLIANPLLRTLLNVDLKVSLSFSA